MKENQKSILINGIMRVLNEKIQSDNKVLAKNNLYSEQKTLHGGDMFFKLCFMSDDKIDEVAKAAGV